MFVGLLSETAIQTVAGSVGSAELKSLPSKSETVSGLSFVVGW